MHSDHTSIDRVRQRAYELWELDGRRHGHDCDYWLRAEREIAEQDSGSNLSSDAKGKPSRRSSALAKGAAVREGATEPKNPALRKSAAATTRRKVRAKEEQSPSR